MKNVKKTRTKEETVNLIKQYEELLREQKTAFLEQGADVKLIVLYELYRTLHDLEQELKQAA